MTTTTVLAKATERLINTTCDNINKDMSRDPVVKAGLLHKLAPLQPAANQISDLRSQISRNRVFSNIGMGTFVVVLVTTVTLGVLCVYGFIPASITAIAAGLLFGLGMVMVLMFTKGFSDEVKFGEQLKLAVKDLLPQAQEASFDNV